MEKFRISSEKAVSYLVSQMGDDGVLIQEAVNKDLCSQYKLPRLLESCGHNVDASCLLDRIKRDFMQENGDFLSYPEKEGRAKKSSSFPMSHFWCYMNGWIAMGAQKCGRSDISKPAFEFCKTFFNPDYNMVQVTESYSDKNSESTMDCLSTAHFGLLCLFMGETELAVKCGEGLLKFVADQPDVNKELFLRVSVSSGKIITTAPANMEPFYIIKKDSPKQLYFFIGYIGIFMVNLHRAIKDQPKYLKCARSMIDFALTCHESICVFSFSHKVAYAAALVAAETKEAKYRRLAIAIGEYLVSIQTEEGLFCPEMDLIDRFDQTAEIALWLQQIYCTLKDINP